MPGVEAGRSVVPDALCDCHGGAEFRDERS